MSNDFAYRIKGGLPIRGEIECLGAKNFATKAMVAAILGDTPTTLTNIPPIGDTQITTEMLTAIGVAITPVGEKTLYIDPSTISQNSVPMADSGSNRVPILLLGALLHRFKDVTVPVLGGCKIGERKVDFHLEAIEHFGGKVEITAEGYVAHRGTA
jgi:UDP-N-acetylglucosamine 1-carboxyvinyltransferase